VSRGHKVRPVPRAKPARPVPLVQQVRRAHKARKDPSAHRAQLVNAVQPAHQVHLEPWDRKVRKARLADKVLPDLLASAALPDLKDQSAQPALQAPPARRAIPTLRPRFASSRERIALAVQMARFLQVLCAPAAPRMGRNAQHLPLLRLGCVCVGDLRLSCSISGPATKHKRVIVSLGAGRPSPLNSGSGSPRSTPRRMAGGSVGLIRAGARGTI
jgi:hypothetical protein